MLSPNERPDQNAGGTRAVWRVSADFGQVAGTTARLAEGGIRGHAGADDHEAGELHDDDRQHRDLPGTHEGV